MTDITHPTTYPEQAAFQLVVELIRAEKVPMQHDNVTNILKMYDEAVAHFKNSGDFSDFRVEVI
ncbi:MULTISPECIES: ATP-NAD kinase [Klebsiella]|uniref:ATP-NAD kinase n=1 Tax=Klebsiella TaxID=570 RepID=UPI001C7FF870|nr:MULTISPECIES: ATP-NAD kinase [Klebsiella]MBX4738234.1 ATP-NAD kinase [Klebsiella sp. CVUAS 10975.2]MDD9662549.1 ATP-NAD kinase [Klebsiella pasteurii]MDD9670193.1 ATP-NAD kinase [Klebsiella pasteurii]MDD9685529.1 ATP-NAD kinase [Klebsiella pasteurii]